MVKTAGDPEVHTRARVEVSISCNITSEANISRSEVIGTAGCSLSPGQLTRFSDHLNVTLLRSVTSAIANVLQRGTSEQNYEEPINAYVAPAPQHFLLGVIPTYSKTA